MASFVPHTVEERELILRELGLPNIDRLFDCIPVDVPKLPDMDIAPGMSEADARRAMERFAAQNRVYTTIYRGAGAYKHYIPALVSRVAGREGFLTAYTPYQPEISQGILQSIFEYQSMICRLTGLDVSNASVYDGATAAAEAAAMCRERKRQRTLVSASAQPDVIGTMRTYAWGANAPLDIVPTVDGLIDINALKDMLTDDVSAVYVQSPNYFGLVEDVSAISEIAHAAGAKLIMAAHPFAMALYKSPAECGADIAVGEGQPLGIPLNYGGPYLGFMAATTALMRKLPGRIVGQTTDKDDRRMFVLTLQAREQHIRREKASSNICSNQAHNALCAAVYLSVMGATGLSEAAEQCYAKAHYLCDLLTGIPGFARAYAADFFNEFVIKCPDAYALSEKLAAHGILAGLPLSASEMLFCATEMNTKDEMDALKGTISMPIT